MNNKQGKKGTFNKAEKETLHRISNDVASGKKIVGVAAYGSQVANYATEDSDYDIIVVLEDYTPKVKYCYIKAELEISALLVDKEILIADAQRASLGEFVAGRMLNIYLPLSGKKFFKEVENIIKKRVIVEALNEIGSSLGEFSEEIRIPVEYFLFDKLKKRASIYPPVLYSYAKTYGDDLIVENTEAACRGFRDALKDLEVNGLIILENGLVRIIDNKSKRWATVFSGMIKYTQRGLTQYAVHGYAGRVGINIISKEVMSKISRVRKGYETPELIKNPKNLWRLDEGDLIVGEEGWLEKVLDHFQLVGKVSTSKDNIGDAYSASKVYSARDKERKVKFIVKRYADIKAVKWVALNIWALMSKRFDMSPISRLSREYSSLKKFRELGINTPKVLVVAFNQRILVTEFIEGLDLGGVLSKILKGEKNMLKYIKSYGEELGKVHKSGYTLGDTKPSNSIVSNGKIFLIDLEQVAEDGDPGWDIAEFIYYSSKLTLDVESAKQLTSKFLDGYLEYGEKDSVGESLKLKYLAPFQPILAPNVVAGVRRVIKKRTE